MAEKGTGSRSKKMNCPNLNMNNRQNKNRPNIINKFLNEKKKSIKLIIKSRIAVSLILFQEFFLESCFTIKLRRVVYIKI